MKVNKIYAFRLFLFLLLFFYYYAQHPAEQMISATIPKAAVPPILACLPAVSLNLTKVF